MVRRDGMEIRRERIQEIAQRIQRLLFNHGELSLSEMIGKIMYDYGCTRNRATEYLEVIEAQGHFEIDREHDKILKVKASG